MALDPKLFFYSDGTISLENGSDIAIGDMVFWDTAVLPFDTLYPNDGQNGVTVIKEVLSVNQLRLAKPWTGPTLTNVPYFVLRWVRHTDPRVYAVRVSEYLTRLKGIPDNIEQVAAEIHADRVAIEAAMVALRQIEQAVDADRDAAETAAGAAQQAEAAAADSANEARQWAEAASSAVIPDNGVTNAKLADMPAGTVKANLAGTAGDPTDVPLTELKTALGGSLARGAISGLTLSNNGTDAINDINIAPGYCRDLADTLDMRLASAITKRLDAAWAVGSGNGGLDTGAKAASASYHVWLIRRDNDGAIDALFSGSATNPAMPTGWTAKRRLGAVTTDETGAIRPFRQIGGWFHYKSNTTRDVSAAANTAATLRNLLVPAGIKVMAEIAVWMTGETTGFGFVRDPDLGIPTVATDWSNHYHPAGVPVMQVHQCWTNTARRVYTGDTSTNATITIWTRGWFDPRESDI